MELNIQSADGCCLPQGCYVGVRIGDMTQQGKYEPQRTFRFPGFEHQERDAKIDVYQHVGSCYIELDPDADLDSLLEVDVATLDPLEAPIKLKVYTSAQCEAVDSCTKRKVSKEYVKPKPATPDLKLAIPKPAKESWLSPQAAVAEYHTQESQRELTPMTPMTPKTPKWDQKSKGSGFGSEEASSLGTNLTRMRKHSILAAPAKIFKSESDLDEMDRTTSVNEEMLREKVRQLLQSLDSVYHVSMYYDTNSVWSALATNWWFENVTLFVIFLNCIWIAVDTDLNKADTMLQAHWSFQTVEHLFCIYFTFELLVRFLAFTDKTNCLRDAWFVFDGVLVLIMHLETFVMAGVLIALDDAQSQQDTARDASHITVLRIARLLRCLRMARLAKLLRSIPELFIFIKGMLFSARSVASTLSLLVVFLYIFGIAFTQLCKNTEVGAEHFPSVTASMYSLLLYGVFCLDYVEDVAGGLAEVQPLVAALYFVFVLLTAFTVMNMLIGVLCEVVSRVAAQEKEVSVLNATKDKLRGIVEDMDEDGNMLISKREFVRIIDSQAACCALNDVGVDVLGLIESADAIFETDAAVDSPSKDIQLTFDEFIEIVLQLRGSSTSSIKDIVELRRILRGMSEETNQLLTQLSEQIVDPALWTQLSLPVPAPQKPNVLPASAPPPSQPDTALPSGVSSEKSGDSQDSVESNRWRKETRGTSREPRSPRFLSTDSRASASSDDSNVSMLSDEDSDIAI